VSALSTRAGEYLALRRSLGFTLRAEGRLLRSFAGFAGEEHLATVTIEAAVRWATAPSGTSRSWHAQRLGVVRGFARYLQAIGDCCEVPPPELLAFPKGRAQPYLYSQAEIASLMDAARALVPELRAATYETVIGLLATTGMRGGEAIRLDRSDVDLAGGMVTVVSSKFGRTRLLPLHPSTAEALDAYASRRDRLCPRPQDRSSFFLAAAGARLVHRSLGATFARLVRDAGVGSPPASGRGGPRPHDLRH
jgi:integrase